LRTRETRSLAIRGSRPLECEHLMHVGHCVNPKQEGVEDGERNRNQAEAERHGGHNRQGDERRAPESTQRVRDIARRVVYERHLA
jgi:hypothetical protein